MHAGEFLGKQATAGAGEGSRPLGSYEPHAALEVEASLALVELGARRRREARLEARCAFPEARPHALPSRVELAAVPHLPLTQAGAAWQTAQLGAHVDKAHNVRAEGALPQVGDDESKAVETGGKEAPEARRGR